MVDAENWRAQLEKKMREIILIGGFIEISESGASDTTRVASQAQFWLKAVNQVTANARFKSTRTHIDETHTFTYQIVSRDAVSHCEKQGTGYNG